MRVLVCIIACLTLLSNVTNLSSVIQNDKTQIKEDVTISIMTELPYGW
ncbi:exported protein of unknown function [Petrocella atlantisensis]|uniref:Uncharacterized protein n=1 Tax=Petrocella atlantisensis TaxID=2173034 RepID=A0A3P7SA07_9FIRM|nr:exported protein of unknown function [Petrocella atlantisensis]